MKTKTLLSLLLALVAAAHADTLNLRYDWAATPAGPFTPIPPENIKVHADGTASVVTSGPRGFFQLLFADATGGGATVPVQTFDSLPETTKFAVRELLQTMSRDGSSEGEDWIGTRLPVFVTPVTSAWNTSGVADMVEIKIVGPPDQVPAPGALFRSAEGLCRSPDRGFIMAGVSRKVPPIVGYSTRGLTPTEELLRSCSAGNVRSIVRFGPAFLGALDSDGALLGNRGLLPAIYTDQAYRDRAAPVSRTWDTESATNPRMPDRPANAVPRTFTNFPQLLAAYRATPFLQERRLQMEPLIEFDWLSLEGRAPALRVAPGERLTFLDGQTFTRYWLDDEDTARPAEIVLGRAGEGLQITGGTVPGAYRLTLADDRGALSRHLVQVQPRIAARGGAQPAWKTKTKVWEAGTDAMQPRFSQRSDLEQWCDSVGCGPVMLAIMIAWAEHNQNVPSAWFDRAPGSAASLRTSLRNIDSPLEYDDGDFNLQMKEWYDFLHDECDVACWANGAGSSLPWDVGSVLENYLAYGKSPLYLPLQAGDPGTGYIGGHKHWENDGWGDDWDEAGIRVANAIKAGRPGGVYYMEHWHYAVAWRYRKTTYELTATAGGNEYVIQTNIARMFRVNMGWGAGDGEDHVWNAYDIDGCYLLNIWQRRLPPP